MPISRYDRVAKVSTPLDPMAAALSWIRGLRSTGLSAELLSKHHGFTKTGETKTAARAIASHAEVAVALLEQALNGPAHVSYIAGYYGLLDLAKIAIIASGQLARLQTEKWHGMSWTGIQTAAQELQTDHITLHARGAAALFYRTLTGTPWVTPSRSKRRLAMRDVYPYIQCVSFEYGQLYGIRGLAALTCEIESLSEHEARACLNFYGDASPMTHGRNHFKLLAGLKREDDNTYVSAPFTFKSPEEAQARAGQAIRRRYLLYSHTERAPLGAFSVFHGGAQTMRPTVTFPAFMTPVSSSTLLLPEELPILLAFFHLGNVVRYDPSRLARLRDSRACSIIDVLLAEGIFSFVVRIWSFLNKSEHAFNS